MNEVVRGRKAGDCLDFVARNYDEMRFLFSEKRRFMLSIGGDCVRLQKGYEKVIYI